MIVASIFLYFIVSRRMDRFGPGTFYFEGLPRDISFFFLLLILISTAYEWALRKGEKKSDAKPK